MNSETPVVILCGGQGTRIREASESLPKAMVEIGGRPILWYIMKIYNSFGYRRFVLCLGYKSWTIKEFFLDYRSRVGDFTLSMFAEQRIELRTGAEEDWEITFAETGLDTATGARLRRVHPGLWLEHAPLQRLARDGRLNVHRHEDFWSSMDTYKDYRFLNDLWAGGDPPWKVWP